MSKSWAQRVGRPGFLLLGIAFWVAVGPAKAESIPSSPTYGTLADSILSRTQQEVERVAHLVEIGTLPPAQLEQVKRQLADAQDDVILAHSLYGTVKTEDLQDQLAQDMVAAAQRRVDRQRELMEERQKLVDAGILARAEFEAFREELEGRQRVLTLAQNRLQLHNELKKMAENERELERARAWGNAAALKNAMIRYDGNGLFHERDLTTIAAQFEKRWGRALPISALGQTALHQSMGLDHRNRVDVALNPDTPEGIWLRQLLERLHVPYLGFRAAISGAATAPHVHIGTGSTRLKLALR